MSEHLPFVVQSPFQRIELTQDAHGHLVLRLNGAQQFHAYDEHRYHEALGVVPLLYAPGLVRHATIFGGGDGLLARTLLRSSSLERLTVVELDAMVADLATHHARLATLNEHAFHDRRVTLVEADATRWVRDQPPASTEALFVDFPDVTQPELEGLYDEDFLRACGRLLGTTGVFAMQVKLTPACFGTVCARVAAVFPHVAPYHAWVPTHVAAGFVLASATPLAQRRSIEGAWRFLTQERLAAMFQLPSDLGVRGVGGPVHPSLAQAVRQDSAYYAGLAELRR